MRSLQMFQFVLIGAITLLIMKLIETISFVSREGIMTYTLCDTRVRVDLRMACERVQFHEMGLDDRLLKVTSC